MMADGTAAPLNLTHGHLQVACSTRSDAQSAVECPVSADRCCHHAATSVAALLAPAALIMRCTCAALRKVPWKP